MSKERVRKFLSLPLIPIVSSFLLTFLFFTLAFGVNGLGFLGTKSILISDMKSQYVHFFLALRNGDVLYTDTVGLGGSFSGTFAYYLSSPFSLLVFLFKKENIETALFLIISLKLSFAASSFCYMQYSFMKKTSGSLVIFPLCYSLMSFGFFFFINVFWLDSFIYLPLLVLSLIKLKETGSSRFMPLLLSIMFISNFYISYIVGLFLLLFLLTECIKDRFRVKDILARVGRLVLYAVIAIALSSFLLLPAAKDFLSSIKAENFDGYSTLNFTLKQFVLKLFPGSYDSIGNVAAPTIFCGTLVFILSLGFFFLKGISKREKLCYLGLVGTMLLSFLLPFLDRVWHVFSYPNAFAYRYAFCFSFLLIYLSQKVFLRLDELPMIYIFSWFSIPVLCLVFFKKLSNNISKMSLVTLIVSVSLILALLILMKSKKLIRLKNLLVTVLVAVNLLELFLNGALILYSIERKEDETAYVFSEKQEWTSNYTFSLLLLEETKGKGLYRTENLLPESYNEAASLRYHGVSLFSSCYSPKLQSLYTKLGYFGEYKGYGYLVGSVQTDRLFGIRWLLSDTANIYNYHVIAENNGLFLLELDEVTPFSIMFPVSDEIYSLSLTNSPEDNIKSIFNLCYSDYDINVL